MSYGSYETGTFILWGVVLAIGAVLAWMTLRAGVREPSRPILALGGGLLVVGVAAPIFWMASYVMTDDLEFCSFGTTAVLAIGFLLILYSVRMRNT